VKRLFLALLLACWVSPAAAVMAIKQSTATTITMGPFYDANDGITPESALTVTNFTCTVTKHDDALPVTAATTFSPTTEGGGANDMVFVTSSQGEYQLELTAGNTDTLGRMRVHCIDVSDTIGAFADLMVMAAVQYDATYGTDNQQVHVIEYTAGVIDSTAVGTLTGGDIGVGAFAANAITDAAVANTVQVDVLTIETVDATNQLDTAADTVTVTSIGAGVIDSTAVGTLTGADLGAPTNWADLGITVTTGEVDVNFDNSTGTISDAQIDTIGVDVLSVSGDVNVADHMETMLDLTIKCTVDSANFTPTTTAFQCDPTDLAGGAITAATGDWEGKSMYAQTGGQIRDQRFISDTTWDGANNEMKLTTSRAWPGALANTEVVFIDIR
jgi:hypothetical protein